MSLLNAVDGCLPSDLATGSEHEIEEEMRLLYVAMTRAKDHLDLLVPQRFYVTSQAAAGDRHVYASRTRFIPNRLLRVFRPAELATAEPTNGLQPRRRAAERDRPAARMRAMWNEAKPAPGPRRGRQGQCHRGPEGCQPAAHRGMRGKDLPAHGRAAHPIMPRRSPSAARAASASGASTVSDKAVSAAAFARPSALAR